MKIGPIQYEDELLLQAIIKMTCPLKCVELGFLEGYSTRKILEAMSNDAQLISYDNSIDGHIDDNRFTFKRLSQTDYDESNVDFIFFDASHDLELNKITFEKIIPSLNDGAIIAIHDTGLWNEMIIDTQGKFVSEGYAHRPDEREFVNWIKETYPNFQQIHFHTLRQIRHGMTILQKYRKL